MAVKLPSFRLLPAAGAKSRVLVALFIMVGVIVGGYFLIQFLSGSSDTTGSSHVAAAPEGLQSVPGGKLSPEYYRALSAANAEASRQAQMTGGSAVPTLVNVPTVQPVYQPQQQNCKILCPDRTKIDVKADVESLVKSKKLSRKEADALLDMASKNVSEEEFASNLDELVRQGKLTPAQARSLLEKFRKQRRDVLNGKSALLMDGMIRNGELSLNEANRLLALQKSGISAAGYSAALKREVRDGRLSAQASAKLLGHYTDLQMQEAAAEGTFKLKQLVAQGAITQGVGDQLVELQKRNVGAKEYDKQLNLLVDSGKMTPATAKDLLKTYKEQRARTGSADALTEMISQMESVATECIQKKVGQGGFKQSDADALTQMLQKGINMTAWQATVSQFDKDGRCTPEVAKQLVVCYQRLAALREEAKRLQALQADNASQSAYGEELKRAVQSGLLKPQVAGDLMQEYSAIVTPVTAPAAAADTTLPGAEDFARLQQAVQQQAASPTVNTQAAAAQFAAAELQAKEKLDAEKQQRLQQMQTAMMSQAQTLLTAWQQPPTITHVAAQVMGATNAGKQGTGTAMAARGGVGATSGTGLAAVTPSLPPLIKSGTIYYAVLDTAVDSDYPDTPVMATIVQGPFNGARVLGKLSLAQGQDRVSLNFNLMDASSWGSAKSINAFAIDPDTARTVMATSVDHHYLKRYGGLFAASFLNGYSNAITNAGTSTTGIFGTSTSTPELNPGNRLAVALGEVGKAFTTVVQQNVNTPATVRINSGVAIGVMFTADVAQS